MENLSRANLLINQGKNELAEKEIRLYLAENPNDGEAYSLLSLALINQRKNKEATESARKGVAYDPNSSFALYIMAIAHLKVENEYAKAEKCIFDAIKINPNEAQYYNVLALIKHDRKEFKEAIKYVDKALEIDPEDPEYKTTKALILQKLNDLKSAEKLIDNALKDDPENAFSLAGKAYIFLEDGEVKKSLDLFKEALRIDPLNEYAKSGLVLALKAQNPLFNMFYKYYVWVSKMSSGMQWGLVIGLFILTRILNFIGKTSPQLEPTVTFLLVLYSIFVFLTWSINPIFNLFLRFNRYGKYALTKDEILASNLVFGLIVASAIQFVANALYGYPFLAAFGTAFMVITISGAFTRYNSKHFKKLIAYNCIIAAMLILYVSFRILEIPTAGTLGSLSIIGLVGFTWYVQMLKN